MAVAVFNYAVWAALYPTLAAYTTDPQATGYFGQACLILDNTNCSVVQDVNARLALLNLLVAHMAVLYGPTRQGTVGRVSDAAEGSVHVTLEYQGPQNAQWFLQTQYGAQFWQSTVSYRSARYVPGPRRFLGTPGAYGLGYGNPWNRGGQ